MAVKNSKTTTKIFLGEELIFVEEKDRYSARDYQDMVDKLIVDMERLFSNAYFFKISTTKNNFDNSVENDIYLIAKEANDGEEENQEEAEEIHDNPDYPGNEEVSVVPE